MTNARRSIMILVVFTVGSVAAGSIGKRASDPLLTATICYAIGVCFAFAHLAMLLATGIKKEEINIKPILYAAVSIPVTIGLAMLNPVVGAIGGYYAGALVVTDINWSIFEYD